MPKTCNVYLIGPMGSGKTAVGRRLARSLQLGFYDSDIEIERRTGVDIPYIFEKESEAGFREREREVIDSLTQLSDVVIATGGGAVLMPENRQRLASRGRVVYLKTGIEQQLQRTRHDRQRPLLHTENPEAKLRELMAHRAPLYESIAAITVATDGRHVRAVAEEIAQRLMELQVVEPGSMNTPGRERVDITLGDRSYPILIGPDLLEDAPLFNEHIKARNLLIVTNTTIAPLYLDPLKRTLHDRRVSTVVLPDGEQFKTLDSMARIIDALIENRMNRDAAVIALGGGVIGDTAGFAAACYQRGVDYVQIPTTLLAQVDSSVGGKTGVNHPQAKNMIGAFHQPRCVITDTRTLRTLAEREYRAGIAEVVKYGLIFDVSFLGWLEVNVESLLAREDATIIHAVRRSCEIKARIVALDEREQGLRAILNLGHTFGHAVEAASGYGAWLHGEAVAAGMVMAAHMSQRLGWLTSAQRDRVIHLLERFQLPIAPPRIGVQRARELMGLDKKVLDGRIRLVLLRTLGQADIVGDYPAEVLDEMLHAHFD